jgi:STE24 endopeptidase
VPFEAAIGLVVALSLALALARLLGRPWWIPAAPLLVAAALGAVWASPLLGPTLHPLRDRALAASLRPAHVRVGVEKLTKRRTANAEAIGIGSTRRIVFTSTLFDGRYDERELRVIGQHELAHLERHHLLKGVGWLALFALPCTYVLARAGQLRGGLRRPEAVPAVLLAAFCLQLVALPVGGAISRRYEAEADWIALERTRDPAAARGLLAGFARYDLDQPDPPRWAHLLLGDHPTLLERIAMAQAWSATRRR